MKKILVLGVLLTLFGCSKSHSSSDSNHYQPSAIAMAAHGYNSNGTSQSNQTPANAVQDPDGIPSDTMSHGILKGAVDGYIANYETAKQSGNKAVMCQDAKSLASVYATPNNEFPNQVARWSAAMQTDCA